MIRLGWPVVLAVGAVALVAVPPTSASSVDIVSTSPTGSSSSTDTLRKGGQGHGHQQYSGGDRDVQEGGGADLLKGGAEDVEPVADVAVDASPILFLGGPSLPPQLLHDDGASSLPVPAAFSAEKPITPALRPSSPPVPPTPTGRNIISNVYFPIEKLNKNLISTNESPAAVAGGSSSSSGNSNSLNNNNNQRRRGSGGGGQGTDDLRSESHLITNAEIGLDSATSTSQAQKGRSFSYSSMGSALLEREATNVTAQLNNHAYLNCKLNRTLLQISQVSNKSVSWVRMRDDHILTVNRVTFIADERFHSFYDATNGVWTLQVKYVQEQDNGHYECQVGTEPKLSAQVLLNVVVPKTEMVGERIRYVKGGSNVILRCIVRDALEPPLYISWFYNGHQIYNENSQGWKMAFERNILATGPEVPTTSGSGSNLPLLSSMVPVAAAGQNPSFYQRPVPNIRYKSIGSLIIPTVRKRDTGNYTCSPSNSGSVTVMLHVIHGDYSASAITSSSSRGRLSDLITIIISVAILNAT